MFFIFLKEKEHEKKKGVNAVIDMRFFIRVIFWFIIKNYKNFVSGIFFYFLTMSYKVIPLNFAAVIANVVGDLVSYVNFVSQAYKIN